MRRNQVLGDLRVLRDERRLDIEHDHPAELSFECHKIEEQFVLLESKVIHRNTPLMPAGGQRPTPLDNRK